MSIHLENHQEVRLVLELVVESILTGTVRRTHLCGVDRLFQQRLDLADAWIEHLESAEQDELNTHLSQARDVDLRASSTWQYVLQSGFDVAFGQVETSQAARTELAAILTRPALLRALMIDAIWTG